MKETFASSPENGRVREEPKVYYGEVIPPRKPLVGFARSEAERLYLVRLELQNWTTHVHTHKQINHYHVYHTEEKRRQLSSDPVEQITEFVDDSMRFLGAGLVITGELLTKGIKAYRAYRKYQKRITETRGRDYRTQTH